MVVMVHTAADENGQRAGLVIDVAVDFASAGAVVVLGSCDAVTWTELVEVVVSDDVSAL